MFSISKRVFDVLLSLAVIITLSPVFLLLFMYIKVDSPGPILFRQKRVGKGKEEFEILKFRTMKIDAPKDMPTHLLDKPEAYITRSGKFLRKTSLDELPQFFNILKGDMSLIGPRPALWNQFDLIEERDKYKANDVMPGLTGLAQINGRDELPIEMKAKIDGGYVEHMTMLLDMKILVWTFVYVFKSEGVREGEKATKKL
ncbi:sugar transferase [Planomicrobium sp. MB-3u-38]|uniref:sugar transferase n=1 Tax=Planomicrobium sp. MB-3u-38 TaxID=2058318 RepID=UPI000C7D3952|nr:sugar transferase [Planomicrobium sp. MB-3u-38]PKH10204.1 lipid carrier--UDP-N-acetylgalactosaminyltransferase [Planomicrobium sp. MB-3u-38]